MPAQLFVGDVPSDARERDVEDFFRKYGRIENLSLKGTFAFVDFEDPRDADDAIYECDGKRLLGVKVRVERARGTPHGSDKLQYERGRGDHYSSRDRGYDRYDRGGGDRGGDRGGSKREPVWLAKYGPPTRTKYRVRVENVSTRCSWQDLKDFMRKAGNVTYAECHKDEERTGIVEFETIDDMKKALEKLDGSDINGRAITMKEIKSSQSRSRSRSRSRRKSSRSRSRSHRSRSKSRSRSRSR